ncbi:hypothetical protein RJ639_044999 [Escallonia herrerae]|uniref:AMP-dependent synthetase/ligase domain-containing protein n=1 Tax=Escallonia herrerae TaxID=1293975 RepID=A0AA88WC34_9ASTE|nr:hypothetical protein RJ639_044999 [Escallonia herrerae]
MRFEYLPLKSDIESELLFVIGKVVEDVRGDPNNGDPGPEQGHLASSIKTLNIRRGHVVSVVATNIPAMYELHFVVPMAGTGLNNVNTRLDSRTISVLLRCSESKLLFVDHQSTSLIQEAIYLLQTTPRSHRRS